MRYLDTEKQFLLKNGETLVLRRPMALDAEEMISYLNIVGGESDNLLFGAGEMTMTTQQEASYIDNMNEDENSLMVIGTVGGEIAAIGQISALARKRIAHNAQVSISVKKAYWRLGIASAVMAELIQFAKHRNIKNICLEVKADNENAIMLYEKYGFERVGVHKDFFFVDGKYYDELIMMLYLNNQSEEAQ